jgi:plasmid stabilization system protein ParE
MTVVWKAKARDDLKCVYERRKNFAGVRSAMVFEQRIHDLIESIDIGLISHLPEFPPAPECRALVGSSHFIIYSRTNGVTTIARVRGVEP